MFTLCVYWALRYLLHDSLLPLLHTQHRSPPPLQLQSQTAMQPRRHCRFFISDLFFVPFYSQSHATQYAFCVPLCVCLVGGILGVSVTWETPLSHHCCQRVPWRCKDPFAVGTEKAASWTSLNLLNKLFSHGDPIRQYRKKALLSKKASQGPPAVRYCLDYTLWWAPPVQKVHTYLWSCTGGAIKHEKQSTASVDSVEKEGGWEM